MKKLLISLAAALSLVALPATALAAQPGSPGAQGVQRVPAWNLANSFVINFSCVGCVPHYVQVTSSNPLTGAFTGSGYSTVNSAYTFTVSGTVTGSTIAMLIYYTGLNPGYSVSVNGTIAPDGSMSGAASDSAFQTFTWATASGSAYSFATHGALVSSQPDKMAAARSNLAMPVAGQ